MLLSALAAALLTAVPAAVHAQAPTPAAVDRGDFQVEFGSFKKANRSVGGMLRRSKAMEKVAAEVNTRWALPRDIPVVFSDEIDEGPAFFPDLEIDKQGTKLSFIHFPGSFLTLEHRELRKQLRGVRGISARQATIAANEFVLAHEIGHALVYELKLPVTGREEDAVDGFAAYLLAKNPKFGPLTALSAAMFFAALTDLRGKLSDTDFADEHSIHEQRVYQFLCWMYGSDRKRFKGIVGPDLLPHSRAVRCGDEWRQVNRSWNALLAPHAKG